MNSTSADSWWYMLLPTK